MKLYSLVVIRAVCALFGCMFILGSMGGLIQSIEQGSFSTFMAAILLFAVGFLMLFKVARITGNKKLTNPNSASYQMGQNSGAAWQVLPQQPALKKLIEASDTVSKQLIDRYGTLNRIPGTVIDRALTDDVKELCMAIQDDVTFMQEVQLPSGKSYDKKWIGRLMATTKSLIFYGEDMVFSMRWADAESSELLSDAMNITLRDGQLIHFKIKQTDPYFYTIVFLVRDGNYVARPYDEAEGQSQSEMVQSLLNEAEEKARLNVERNIIVDKPEAPQTSSNNKTSKAKKGKTKNDIPQALNAAKYDYLPNTDEDLYVVENMVSLLDTDPERLNVIATGRILITSQSLVFEDAKQRFRFNWPEITQLELSDYRMLLQIENGQKMLFTSASLSDDLNGLCKTLMQDHKD